MSMAVCLTGRLLLGGINQGITDKEQYDNGNKAQKTLHIFYGTIWLDKVRGIKDRVTEWDQ